MSRVGAMMVALAVATGGSDAGATAAPVDDPTSIAVPIESAAETTEDASEGAELDVAVSDALVLEPGATCLEHDRLTEQVVTWLGRDVLDPRLAVVVEGSTTEVNTLRFVLEASGQPIAERVFAPGPSRCQDLHAVVALAIALAIDAPVLESVGIVTEPEPVPRAPQPPAELPPVVVERPPPEPSPGPDLSPRERPWSLRLRGGGLVTVGVPPPLGGGAELGLEIGWRDVLDLQAGILGASAGPQPIDDATLEITLLAGRVDLCAGPSMGRVRPRFCGGVIAGSAMAEGRGFVYDFQTVVPWVAGVFGGDLRIALTRRLALSFDLDGLVTVVRPVFDVREERQVRKLRDLPRFGAAFGAGLVVGFGEGRRGARP